LGSGLIDMWRISPIFQGVGVSLMLVQGLTGVYNMVVVSWMFVYFRDSFDTLYDTGYKWTMCQFHVPAFSDLRRCSDNNPSLYNNTSGHSKIEETIPDYFAATVLQRKLPVYPRTTENWRFSLKFQVVFNLVVAWMIVFICLSRGLKSYGKVVYLFGPVPLICFIVFATKVLGLFPLASFEDWLYDQDWSSYIYNAKSWVCAAKECFFTWSFFGASLLQLASHNKFRHNLKRDTTIIVIITLLFFTVSGILGVAIHRLVETSGQYTYIPSSFETYESWKFLNNLEFDKMNNINNNNVFNRQELSSSALKAPSPSEFDHVSYLAGIRIISPDLDSENESGYKVHRLATELIPAYFSILGPKNISQFWCVLFYFTLIMLGIGQCLALFHTVIQGIIAIKASFFKPLEGSVTFVVCSFGFLAAIPAGCEMGIFVVYFLDNIMGSAWWVMVLYLVQLFAVMVVRGKPYGSEQIVSVIFPKKACCSSWIGPLLAFTWNVVLPIALLIMAVVTFKTGLVAEMFNWSMNDGYVYLPSWVREIGSMMQIMPLLIIPFVGIIQSCRYFLHGPDNILERLEMLYRPSYQRQGLSTVSRSTRTNDVILTNFTNTVTTSSSAPADPPPKYTPPPSYSTATGARIARMLRQSFRRSVRRLQGARGAEALVDKSLSPPDYAHVVIETARHSNVGITGSSSDSNNGEEVYVEPHDAIIFEMRPTPNNLFNTELGAYSLDLSLPTLQRRSIRRNNNESVQQHQQQQQDHPHGRVVALGVGSLHRADSEAVLMEDAEPINIDSGSEIYAAMSEISIDVGDVSSRVNDDNDHVCEANDDPGDCERVRSSAEMEAINVHVRQNSQHQQVVNIDMDTSTSVI